MTRPACLPSPSRFRTNVSLNPVALACLLALAGGLATSPVYAQTVASSAATRSYNVAAGPLRTALPTFAGQAGITLSFTPEQTKELRTAGLHGTFSLEQGFALLLANSGLQAAPSAAGGYTLQAAPVSAMSTADKTMKEVTVTAQVERTTGTTEGTGSYTAAGPSSTATGLALTLRETPQSVTVMTRQRMDDFQLNNLADVLDQTPGIQVSRRGNFTEFRARGALVNLKMDGARQMSDGWGVTAYSLSALDDMAELDRIEVIKGSSGLTTGDGYPGATVNMIRKRPTAQFQANVSASAGSLDSYRTDADISGPLNASGSLRGRLVASASEAGSFRDNQKTNGRLLFGTVDLDITPDTLLNAGVSWRQRELRGSAGTAPIQAYSATGVATPLTPRSFNIAAPWAGYDLETVNLFTSLEYRFGNGWTATARASHQKDQSPLMLAGALVRDSATTALDASAVKDFTNTNTNASVDLKGPVTLFGRTHDLMLGADYAKFESRSNNYYPTGGAIPTVTLASLGSTYAAGGGAIPLFFNPDAIGYALNTFSSQRTSAYAAGRFDLADPVKLITGARVTNYRKLDVTPYWWNYDMNEHGVVTPYAGLVVDVSPNVSLYGSYASIFQPQSAQTETGRTLNPEEGKTYEVGAKGEFFDKRLNASLAFFRMKTDNTAEAAGGRTPTNGTAYRAVSGATRHGYELEMSGEISTGWQVQGSYVMQNSSLTTASRFPRNQLKLGSTYRLGTGTLQGLTLGAAARWQDATEVTNAGGFRLNQKAYTVVDLMARYQVDRHWSVALNVNNAFDKQYFSDIWSSSNVLLYTWGAPRSTTVSARYDF